MCLCLRQQGDEGAWGSATGYTECLKIRAGFIVCTCAQEQGWAPATGREPRAAQQAQRAGNCRDHKGQWLHRLSVTDQLLEHPYYRYVYLWTHIPQPDFRPDQSEQQNVADTVCIGASAVVFAHVDLHRRSHIYVNVLCVYVLCCIRACWEHMLSLTPGCTWGHGAAAASPWSGWWLQQLLRQTILTSLGPKSFPLKPCICQTFLFNERCSWIWANSINTRFSFKHKNNFSFKKGYKTKVHTACWLCHVYFKSFLRAVKHST